MDCNEYREKFINEEMTPEEKEAFIKHLKECEGCRAFVEKYKKMRDFMKIRTDYLPSNELRDKIVSTLNRKRTIKRLYTVTIPTAIIVIMGTFFVWKPLLGTQKLYQTMTSVGIQTLNNKKLFNAATSTNQDSTPTITNDYTYIVQIKSVSDQF